MICTVIQNKTFDEIQDILEHCEMALFFGCAVGGDLPGE